LGVKPVIDDLVSLVEDDADLIVVTSEALHNSLEFVRNVELVRVKENQNLERPADRIGSDRIGSDQGSIKLQRGGHVRANGGGFRV
jgi:hypothetical protein